MNASNNTVLQGLDALPNGITAEHHGWGVHLLDTRTRRSASLSKGLLEKNEGLFCLELFRFRLHATGKPICHDLATRPRWGRWDELLGRAIAWIAMSDLLDA